MRDGEMMTQTFKYGSRHGNSVTTMSKPRKTELAYWAGIIDGEGYVTLYVNRPRVASGNKTPTVVPMVEINNTFRPLIERAVQFFKSHYGFPLRVPTPVKLKQYPKNHYLLSAKPKYRISVKGDRAVKLCGDVLSYLIVKKKQAQVILEFAEHAPRFKTTRFTSVEVKCRLSYVNRINKINKKGMK